MPNCQNSGCRKKIVVCLILFVILIYFSCKNETPIYLSRTLPGQVEPLVTINQANHKVLRKYDTLPPTVYINPNYIPMLLQSKYRDWEGCYSVPDEMSQVDRYNAIIFL